MALVMIVASVLVGCAVVDRYSSRAITYNLEAEQAQDQALLLNIVRAYLRRPMQFTTVSTITGVASASASAQYTLPTNVPFRPATQGATGIATFPPLPTWLFGGSMSGGPAFTVPVLDTQEFYEGILKAIPGQIWDLYLQANYPPDFLFNLFVQKIVMHRANGCKPTDHTDSCEFVFLNYPGIDIQVNLFQTLVHYLLTLGLTTEAERAPTVKLNNPKNINVNIRYIGKADRDDSGKAEVVAPPGAASSDAPAAARTYKICFAPQTKDYSGCVDPAALCGAKQPPDKDAAEQRCERQETKSLFLKTTAESGGSQIKSSGSASANIVITQSWKERLIKAAQKKEKDDDSSETNRVKNLKKFLGLDDKNPVPPTRAISFKITIYMRHTEGIIYYLGELARRSLNPDFEKARRFLFIKRLAPFDTEGYKELCTKSSKTCVFIFRLFDEPEATTSAFVSVNYSDRWYAVSGNYDPDQPDFSTLSMDFVKQLIALNSSAKSLPQSSVITTVGQ